jgi:hypothetical protein
MADEIELPADGWVRVKLGGVEQRLDLFAAYHRLLQLDLEARDGSADPPPGAVEERVCRYLAEAGFPPESVNQWVARSFALSVYARVGEYQKKTAPAPPASGSAS